ncbi:MAG TPA: hypothetical protein VMH81_10890 [Bryobacteraceae bacterium]|nr:hypothetical protein [Bryobacteraceae bacterium]
MTNSELVEIALHVLVAWNQGDKPDPGEVEGLRRAFPSLANLDVDEIAVQVIHDLSSVAFEEPSPQEQAEPHASPRKLAG